ncbi:hypothetical protein [Lentzea flaviverrucosa]|uniref:Uncharacterized protein n=1 Tax=Lentzea flaviverrucosa TaxID=200379 RepID=A0A1H9VI89_9PSEU|nr:hypothetical protein [Lentzea flaviverrucosa]RDI23852.1 hypothetical protein DFR72_110258 [Lentzea flaviverrucosa]SES20957.1 hypothetical protein SAMN05216195_11078 [Lentzea flaviverrucosa]
MELIALVLLVQGGGGLINNLTGGSRSWFVLNYVEMPDALRVTAYAVMVLLGLVLVVRRFGWDWLRG